MTSFPSQYSAVTESDLFKIVPFALAVGVVMLTGLGASDAQALDDAIGIAAAVLPLPETLRADATVMTRGSDGKAIVARKGSNGLVCINASTPDIFDADCSDERWFDLFEHARELSKQLGAPDNGKIVAEAVAKEIKEGKVSLPDKPSMGYVMRGPISGYHAASNSVTSEIKSWQMIQIPFATGKTMALPEQHSATMAWVMAPGTWMAHIMIEH